MDALACWALVHWTLATWAGERTTMGSDPLTPWLVHRVSWGLAEVIGPRVGTVIGVVVMVAAALAVALTVGGRHPVPEGGRQPTKGKEPLS
jgi:hypothetical protein